MTACPGLPKIVQTRKSPRWDSDRTYQAGRANRQDRLSQDRHDPTPKPSAERSGEASRDCTVQRAQRTMDFE
ncbi:BZ3500_MvSof-1268-A1-R1_Chr9g10302 [Microbotryum saponariae]|uniref:BZ3500_MvSof-1268-A1-R1_C048g00171 protein n=1 Tax=Microbotryum saponariae TaxID=289078 RepID=A0A2X0MQ03_9BASI|nr:BZ3500_MvSof-1268-A1-R1_Chr1-1g00815 [Microbotryum saponariae]SCZ89132.1 BZ3501_MvSof-1269-A2-R1_Chr9g10052 [Microbotryum saponariae]SCZ92737.1 BZ3501_MvSof-1269-A2-R1_Chr1-1g00412 [Microbotryum saponariae]SCZ93995.1 BZ3500_MvSof-1268-A1-R1_Chr6-1g08354 [Microbotryum saponariae]SCZ94884.1 BZ3500_MvSof-1268-A1-R1_C048g00171 [Microbotryum saponariae]